jgi:hypothetical protein
MRMCPRITAGIHTTLNVVSAALTSGDGCRVTIACGSEEGEDEE